MRIMIGVMMASLVAVATMAQEPQATVLLKGQVVALSGQLPQVGSAAPDFRLVDTALQEVSLATYGGKKKIISIVPSLDTSVCALSARVFNERINQLSDAVLLNVSVDLPFAAKRFCEAEGLENIEALSAFRSPHFGQSYGVRIEEGALKGLLARAVLVLDGSNTVRYSELVPDISSEPNYDEILKRVTE